MIDKTKLVQITMPELDDFQRGEISQLDGLYGRDSLADLISTEIDTYCIQRFQEPEPRSHLGASVIGHECERYIWMHFRWMVHEKFKPAKLRLFNRGHLEEDRVIEWLHGIGFTIEQVQDDGKQIRIATACDDHFGGSCDSVGNFPTRYGLPAGMKILVEIKTANGAGFADITTLDKFGSRAKHFIQTSVYGYKLQIQYALYILVNKNNDEIWVQFWLLDWDLAEANLAKADALIHSYYPPKRISDNPSFWKCKMCPMHRVCHLNGEMEHNCRSCRFAEPVAEAEWYCHNFKQSIPKEFIIKGCEQWEALPH